MKKQILIFSALILWAGSLLGVNVQIGSGTETAEQFPIYSYYGYNYSQQIYLGSEISAGGGTIGTISKIRFYYSAGSGSSSTWNNWIVYLGNTSKTAFSSKSDWIPVSSMTEVFSGIIPDPVDGTWLEITLPVPFYYTGDNIVVAVDENSEDFDYTSALWGSFYSGSARGLIYFNDDINPDPLMPHTASMGPQKTIAKVQFEMTNAFRVNVQIGSGTDTTEHFPINSGHGFNYSQQIYLGSEIASGGGAAGIISKIRFYYGKGSASSAAWNNWIVYLGNTSKTEFSSSSDWIPVASMTEVFSGIIPDPVEGTWLEIVLPVPFYYSGDNIVVAVDENSEGSDSPAQWGSFNSESLRGLICYDDNNNPDPLGPPDANVGPENKIASVQFEMTSTLGVNVQIGSGTDTTELFPIYTYSGYNYSQQIYIASEIASGGGAIGTISKIRFYYCAGSGSSSNWNNWTVYLGNTDKTQFSSKSDWLPVASMTEVFSGIIPNPVEGTWLEITFTTPFLYTAGNIVVAVDENSDDFDLPAQWGSFNSGSPRGLLFFDDTDNPDPSMPQNARLGPENTIAKVQFEISNGYGLLEGYVTEEPDCVTPVAGAIIITGTDTTTSNSEGYYRMVLAAGTYYEITAWNHDLSQTIFSVEILGGFSTTQDFCLPHYYQPPVSLQADITGPTLNNVHLTWMQPGSVPDQWIHWDDGTNIDGFGYEGPIVFSVASRWPVTDIAPYDGTYLKKVSFFPTEATAIYTLKVWKGIDAATLLHSQVVADPIINAWNEVTLTTPILVDGTDEFWFGYEVNQTTGDPAGYAPGPAITGKGDMINSGEGWFSMKEAQNRVFNWCLQGFVSEDPVMDALQLKPLARNIPQQTSAKNQIPASVKPQVLLFEQTTSDNPQPSINAKEEVKLQPSAKAPFAPSVNFTGYNVYRDNIKIANNIPDLFFDDLSLPKGGYDYEVSALYNDGESVRIGPLHVDIYTCFPPTNLTVSKATLTTTTADLSWTPSTLSTIKEWELEWGLEGFTQGLGYTVNISTTPGYSLSDLTPGTAYDFYIRTACSSGDASAWTKKTFRTHYFGCPLSAIAESETCGDTTNNGCDMALPAFGNISCGDTVCGTSWLRRSHRDTDWYSFTLTETTDVTLTGNAEFGYIFGITASPCPTSGFIASINSWAGNNSTLIAQLNAGTYYVYIAPAFAEQVECDSLSRYWATLTCSTCLTPTNLSTTNIIATSANLVWTSNASKWNIEWGLAGFSKGTGTPITGIVSNTYTLSGLSTGYSYSYYVQTDCGDRLSYWAGPFTFFIPCPANTLPFTEDFTSGLAYFTPECWQVKGAGIPSNWIVDNRNYAGGSSPQLAFIPYNSSFSGRSFITSPVINTTGLSKLYLSFKQYIYLNNTSPACEVWTTSDGGTTWNSVWSVSQPIGIGPETKTLTIDNIDNLDVGSQNFQFAFAVNGNSLDVQTWQIDDISLSVNKTLNLKVFLEGLYDEGSGLMKQAIGIVTLPKYAADTTDLLTVELHYPTAPYLLAGGPYTTALKTVGTATVSIPDSLSAEYYIVVKHRNSIETWSSDYKSFAGNSVSYDFSIAAYAAFDGNQKKQGSLFMLYGGDGNQDGAVDALDVGLVKNKAAAFGMGYLLEDINGDGIVDALDMVIVDNNASNFVVVKRP